MGILIGRFKAKVGNKGRFSLPPQLKAHMNGRLILVTPRATTGNHSTLIAEGNFEAWTKARGEAVVHWIYANAYETSIDNTGRVLIPHEVRKETGITKGEEIVLLGYGDRVRLMKRTDWEAFRVKSEAQFSAQ